VFLAATPHRLPPQAAAAGTRRALARSRAARAPPLLREKKKKADAPVFPLLSSSFPHNKVIWRGELNAFSKRA
jgi:hypothetical protein